MRLGGKIALVTGAAGGLGAAIASTFAVEGAHVVVSDVADAEGEEVAGGLATPGAYFSLDVTDEAAWDRVVAETLARFGQLDVLVNNAAILRVGPFREFSVNDFHALIDTNQVGCFLGMRAAARAMGSRGGSIINIASVDALRGVPGVLGYAATKWAVRGMTKVAAVELGPLGIRVNAIHPGGMATAMTAVGSNQAMKIKPADEIIGGWPLGRLASPDEVASMAVFLAAEESSFCTGADFVVDGGATAGPPYLERT
jgi:3alpha(or 20beta)-hydroxysteroid dehydrogenase